MKVKIIKNRVLGSLLAFVLLFSAVPVQPVQAASNGAILSEPITMRATTIMFVATTVLIDTSDYHGSLVDAYNKFISEASSGEISALQGTAFHKVLEVNIHKSTQNVYFIDTIRTSLMNTRYFGDEPNNKAVLVNLKDISTTLSTWVGAIMDSPAMNGGKGTILNPEDYLGEQPDKELEVVRMAIQSAKAKGVNLVVPLIKISGYGVKDESFSISVDIEEGSKLIQDSNTKVTYDWSDHDAYVLMTVMQPVMVPSFNDKNGEHIECKYCSLVKDGVFYSNIGYLMKLADDLGIGSSELSSYYKAFNIHGDTQNSDPFVLKNGQKILPYNTGVSGDSTIKFYTDTGGVSSTDGLGQAPYRNLTGPESSANLTYYVNVVKQVCSERTPLDLQDIFIISATLYFT